MCLETTPVSPETKYYLETSGQMADEHKKLIMSSHRVETMINSFPTELMTSDRLETYNSELKDI